MFNLVYRSMTYLTPSDFIFVKHKPANSMLDEFKILTITHKRINLKEIGAFTLKETEGLDFNDQLNRLKHEFGFSELLYTATCNRVMFFFTSTKHIDRDVVKRFFQYVNPELSTAWLDRLPEIVSTYQGLNAIRHLFNVAASIDSLVIGERQILGQLRDSYEYGRKHKLVGDYIKLAMNQAVVCAKAIYSNTQIGDKAVSVVSLATRKLLKTNVKKDDRILIIGAGQTNQLVAKFLDKHQFTNVTVFNRSVGKAEQVAEIVKGKALPLSELANYDQGFDCLIVCTASKEPIITKALYQQLKQGDEHKKVIIDLAIPPNVAEDVVEDFPVNYIEIEGLRSLAKENLALREREVVHAQAILEEYLDEFPTLHKQRKLELAMRVVPNEIKAVKKKALNEVFKKEVEELDEHTKDLVERMMAYMEKKCISIPMKAAREMMI